MIFSKDVPLAHRLALALAVTFTVKALLSATTGVGFARAEICSAVAFWFLTCYQWRTRARSAQPIGAAHEQSRTLTAAVESETTNIIYWVLILTGALTLYYVLK